MKTTLSKSLLCGIIASTFLLANCQKAPSGRTVKAEVGTPGPDASADKATVADKNLTLVQCTPEFTKVYTDFFNGLKSAQAEIDKKDSPIEVHKAELLRFRKELEVKLTATLNEINNLKSDAKTATGELKKVDGCYFDAAKKQTVTINSLNSDLNKVDGSIADITGEKSARSEAAKAAIAAQKTADIETKRLTKGVTYKVSAEFNELLDEPMSSTSKHFVDGRIAEKSELEANKKNIKAAVCEIITANGKLSDDQLVLKTLGEEAAKQENKKNTYSVNLGQLANQGDKVIRITCSLPTDLKKHAGFEKAMGTYLVAQLATDTTAAAAGDDDLARIKARSESAQAMAADASKIEADAKAAADQKAKDDADAKAAADKAAANKATADSANVEEPGT